MFPLSFSFPNAGGHHLRHDKLFFFEAKWTWHGTKNQGFGTYTDLHHYPKHKVLDQSKDIPVPWTGNHKLSVFRSDDMYIVYIYIHH